MGEVHIPTIISNVDGKDRMSDVLSYTFEKKRTIYLYGEITDILAASITAQLSFLASKGDSDITMLINSPGGSVSAGLSIIDAMISTKRSIRVVGTGMVASMATIILSVGGSKGNRYATENAELMIHQPLTSAQGQASDIIVAAKHVERMRARLCEMMGEACGKTSKRLLEDMDRDKFFDAQGALEYGLIDHIGIPSD